MNIELSKSVCEIIRNEVLTHKQYEPYSPEFKKVVSAVLNSWFCVNGKMIYGEKLLTKELNTSYKEFSDLFSGYNKNCGYDNLKVNNMIDENGKLRKHIIEWKNKKYNIPKIELFAICS